MNINESLTVWHKLLNEVKVNLMPLLYGTGGEMRISELLEELKEIMYESGDIEVILRDPEFEEDHHISECNKYDIGVPVAKREVVIIERGNAV